MNPPTDRHTPWTAPAADAAYRFGFLVVPDFTLIGLGSAVDPLRLANQVAGRTVYEYVTLSETGAAVRSSDGIRVVPDASIAGAPGLDAVLVIGPNPIPKRGIEPIVRWLRRLAHAGVALGGVDTGSYFLARAGLLNGYRCTIHWEDMDELLGRFPRLIVSPNLFEVDRDRCSSSGGIAAVDMMIHLIGLGSGSHRLAAAVSELLICEHRGPDERQRVPLRSLLGPGSQKLLEAVTLMECNSARPPITTCRSASRTRSSSCDAPPARSPVSPRPAAFARWRISPRATKPCSACRRAHRAGSTPRNARRDARRPAPHVRVGCVQAPVASTQIRTARIA